MFDLAHCEDSSLDIDHQWLEGAGEVCLITLRLSQDDKRDVVIDYPLYAHEIQDLINYLSAALAAR